ncbi:MAG: hypothetical protein F4X97_13260 [Boseongicola sp. SB0662_bin_57]|nr:hypothetical protein [Boseongicola sp. SB0662_bin_57]
MSFYYPRHYRICKFHGSTEWLAVFAEASCCDSVDTLHERFEIEELLQLFQRCSKSHLLIRNERNIYARCLKTAQVAVKRAWHEAEHANVNQRDDPTWISSFPRVAGSMPGSSKQSKNIPGPCPRNVAFVA